MARHPYQELAQDLEERLRLQRWHDRRGDGVVLFGSEQAEQEARNEAKELRRLARLDLENGYPFD